MVYRDSGYTSCEIGSIDQCDPFSDKQALIFNPDDPHCSKSVFIALDSGSQKSCVTNLLKMELALKPIGELGMSIMMFGSREENSRVCEVVNFCMGLRDEKMSY